MTVFNKIDCYARRFQLAWSHTNCVTTVEFSPDECDFYFLFKDLLNLIGDTGDTSTFSFDDIKKVVRQINQSASQVNENAALIAIRMRRFFDDLSVGWQAIDSPLAEELKKRHSRPKDSVFVKKGISQNLALLRLYIKIAFPTYSANYLQGKIIVDAKEDALYIIGKHSHIQALWAHFSMDKPIPYNFEDDKAYYREELERASKSQILSFEYNSWIRICQLRASL